MSALRELRMLAIRQKLDGLVRADLLIEAALRALGEGVDSPPLEILAGLSHSEEPDAQELFRASTQELGLAPPDDEISSRWDLVRWWCEEMDAGNLTPTEGAGLIWTEAWHQLDCPETLTPFVGLLSEWDDWRPNWTVERDYYEREILALARELLRGPWPPQ